MEIKGLEDAMHGEVDGLDSWVTADAFDDIIDVFESIVALLEDRDIQLTAVQFLAEFDFDVGERQPIVEKDLPDPQLVLLPPQLLVYQAQALLPAHRRSLHIREHNIDVADGSPQAKRVRSYYVNSQSKAVPYFLKLFVYPFDITPSFNSYFLSLLAESQHFPRQQVGAEWNRLLFGAFLIRLRVFRVFILSDRVELVFASVGLLELLIPDFK